MNVTSSELKTCAWNTSAHLIRPFVVEACFLLSLSLSTSQRRALDRQRYITGVDPVLIVNYAITILYK